MISRSSVATTSEVAQRLTGRLRRTDGQENCAFVLWRPSTGTSRTTALLAEVVLPREDERIVHGTVDFTSACFLRAPPSRPSTPAGSASSMPIPKAGDGSA
ncbi:hypothetical protein ACFXAE_24305 [Streptomyces sp. NPDC059454]|jgi:hypothetical protein|uniref:hypothetical protein n=1 Tax=Streptomyces sp. NPDC059454 TaxID=3346836 RepID=UPI0036BB2D84